MRSEADRTARALRSLDVAIAMCQAAADDGRPLTPQERVELLKLHDLAQEVRGPMLDDEEVAE